MKVAITDTIPVVGLERLSALFELCVNRQDRPLSREELLDMVGDAAALVCMLSDSVDADLIDAGAQLRVVANFAVGYNNIDVEHATQKGIVVTNTPGVLTDATADLAWSLLMSIARRIVEGDRFVRSGTFQGWRPQLLLGSDVYGKTIGVVGLGRVGQAVARRALGFGMRVLYCGRTRLSQETERTYQAEHTDLSTLLRLSDFVTLHVPLTPLTYHLIGETELRMMKATACLVNTSRGPVVDEQALIEVLQENAIAGAAMDVYEKEPELSSGLAALRNVVLTPHIGSATRETRDRMSHMVADNVIAVLSGRRPPNPVNSEVLDR